MRSGSNITLPALVLAVFTTMGGAAPSLQLGSPSPDWVIAEFDVREAPFLAVGDGSTDDTAAFQAAIDAAAAQGGGVVFVPAGTYRLNGSLTLKSGVTLRGEWTDPDTNGGGMVGTILAPYGGRGDATGTPLITMEKVTCLRGLSFWYPEQDPEAIVPYPWTIDVTHNSSCGYTLRDVTFVNSYKALSNGAEDGLPYNVAYYDNLFGTPLKQGVWIEYVLDITRLQRFHFSPSYWENSGLPGAPTTPTARAALRAHLKAEATAITVRRHDWCPLYAMRIDGYHVGVHLANKPDIPSGAQNANGEIMYSQVTDCETGLLIDGGQPPGWLVSRSTFQESGSPGSVAVQAQSTFENIIQFHTSEVGTVRMATGCAAAMSFESTTLTQSLDCQGGRVSFVNSAFTSPSGTLTLGDGCDRALLAGCTFAGGPTALVATHPEVVRQEDAPSRYEVSATVFPFPDCPTPPANDLWNVRDHGALGNETTDDTVAFSQALAAAGAAGGGTVYVPAGRYRLTAPLTVPSGVELRGIFEGPPHAMIPGSCLLIECGHGQEDGTPFLTLEASAGVRGLVFWYPDQDIQNIVPYPWTVRAAGPNCWVRDIAASNSWQAVDFASASDTSGHFISGLMGSPLRRGLFVANAATGTVESSQQVIHYWSRNDSGLPWPNPLVDRDGIPFMEANLEAFRLWNCDDERMLGTFVYGTLSGLALADGFKGKIHIHGTDGSSNGLRISGHVEAELVDTNLATWAGSDPVAFDIGPDFTGEALFLNSSVWASCEPMRVRGTGHAVFSQINIWGAFGGTIVNPNTEISNLYTRGPQRLWWLSSNPRQVLAFSECDVLGPGEPFPGRIVSSQCAATADSSHSEHEGPQAAVDGSVNSHWVSESGTDHWWEVDLDQAHRLTGIEMLHDWGVLRGGSDLFVTRDFRLLGRASESDVWTLLAEATDNTDYQTRHAATGKFRFVRLEIQKPTGLEPDTHARINQIRVYAQEQVPGLVLSQSASQQQATRAPEAKEPRT